MGWGGGVGRGSQQRRIYSQPTDEKTRGQADIRTRGQMDVGTATRLNGKYGKYAINMFPRRFGLPLGPFFIQPLPCYSISSTISSSVSSSISSSASIYSIFSISYSSASSCCSVRSSCPASKHTVNSCCRGCKYLVTKQRGTTSNGQCQHRYKDGLRFNPSSLPLPFC